MGFLSFFSNKKDDEKDIAEVVEVEVADSTGVVDTVIVVEEVIEVIEE